MPPGHDPQQQEFEQRPDPATCGPHDADYYNTLSDDDAARTGCVGQGGVQAQAGAEFKRAYRRKQLRWVYEKIKRAEQIKKGDVYKVDQLQAMKWSKEIWQELQGKATIENCFRHTGIVFNGVDERSKKETGYSGDVEVEDIIFRAADLHL
ncbi:unnamed protein product [Phytophthora fragariaefolia]|uniref:Unnamed protein product n=1 Tax=Phytophthora fragariaefolia TaxID=1490495 RepID=A0A9W6XRS3_9STRA|nr:unnamed protein product [Phytophthora fragariaefolia]